MDGKFKILLLFLLGCIGLQAQTFTYNYTDPCTGMLQTVTLSQTSGTVVMFYAGQYQTFTAAQLQLGAYENWIAQINTQFPPGSNPCAGNGSSNANNSNANIGTNTANSVSGIVSISTSIAGSLGGGSVSSGSISTGNTNGSSSSSGSSSNDNTNNNSGSSGSSGGSSSGSSGSSGSNSGGTSGGSSSGGGNTGGSGSSSGGSSGSSGGGNSGRPDSGGSTGGGTGTSGSNPDGGATGGTSESTGGASSTGGTSENTTTASGGESESSGDSGGGGGGGNKPKQKQEKIGRGSLIGSGDFVIIRNGNDISKRNDNVRFNASVTHVNTKQNFIKGVNLNYTTGENVANLTLYGSYKKKDFMAVGSNSFMTDFKSDWFNTVTLLSAQKLWKFTFMGGANFTLGQIGKSEFQNLSVVGGAFTNFKGGKTVSANIMALGVYSPYIFYYEGQWYKSGFLIVPLANVDFKLTDKFKWSISFSGAYQYNADILNFQLSTGTKMLL
jgi:hypothetical protein